MNAGKVGRARHSQRQPGVHARRRISNFAEAHATRSATAHPSRPLSRRDGRAVPLAHPGSALPRVVGRRARVRRHGLRSFSRSSRRSTTAARRIEVIAALNGAPARRRSTSSRRTGRARSARTGARTCATRDGQAVRERRFVLAQRAARRLHSRARRMLAARTAPAAPRRARRLTGRVRPAPSR